MKPLKCMPLTLLIIASICSSLLLTSYITKGLSQDIPRLIIASIANGFLCGGIGGVIYNKFFS